MANPATSIPLDLIDDTGDVHYVPAPCQVACPVGTDAPSYIGYIWEGSHEGALEAISATNPFSAVCGRVCDTPCEPACRRADSDGPIAIRNLKRFVMDRLGPDFHLPPVEVSQVKTVGIVGGGPSGLTAAQDLAEAGYGVHVYEMSDRLGGMMVWGIPAFRLPPGIIEEDIERILGHCPGVEVHLNHTLGDEITLAELKVRHEAVILAIGAWWGKEMGVSGESDRRVMDGVGFLRKVNQGERPEMPTTVVVVGGGDVAMDACRAALRLPGCRRVKVVYRRGPDEIPARRDELESAIEEGVEFVYHTQPVEVVDRQDQVILRCATTEPGEPDEDGRRRPVLVAGSEHEIECGLVIAAVGQRAASEELNAAGLMAGERVSVSPNTMRTADPRVFATGDGAFGPSTIVNAMSLGHRAAYYVKAHLEDRENPLPYSTPFRTRRVPVAQDPQWEVIPRVAQPFHGLGPNPAEFPEIESTYTPAQARAEAARCFRCDAENGTSEYSVDAREDIFIMARTGPRAYQQRMGMLRKRLANRDNPFPGDRGATLDDLHFLPANLSRLVIDPYRENCDLRTPIGPSRVLDIPFLVAGFDAAPKEVRAALVRALAGMGSAYLGRQSPGPECTWFQLIAPGGAGPDPEAAGAIYDLIDGAVPGALARARPEQAVGVAVGGASLREGVRLALAAKCDLLLLDGTTGLGRAWPESAGVFDLTVLRDAILLLRELKQEEQIEVAYFGGVRSGTEAAKLIGLGCQVAVLGLAVGLALGGSMGSEGGLEFPAGYSVDEYAEAALNFLHACADEASMMARATGKTRIHSLEPEDLRAITLATSRATGIPLIGTR